MVEKFLIANKKGWIKIVEAFISVLLLMGILLLAVSGENVKKNDATIMYEIENGLLKEIAINETLRSAVLGQGNLPINSSDVGFSSTLENYISDAVSESINCVLSICILEEECSGYNNLEEDIYVEQSLITSNNTLYSPRILKIFCYVK